MENNTLIPVNEGNGIFIGENAGVSDSLLFDEGFGSMRTTENIFIGNFAGFNNTTGINNTIIGNSSLFSSTVGQSNIAIGTWTLRRDTSGSSNIAIGISALESNNGSDNIAIGASAARSSLSGGSNVIVGDEALRQQRSGSNNVAVGKEAGSGNMFHSKSNSTYIGYNAGLLNQGDDNVFIGSKVASSIDWVDVDSTLAIDISDTSDPLIYGEFNNGLVRINGDLEVTGSFPDTDNQTLSFDGTNLSIADGNSVDISTIDTDTDTDNQTIDKLNLNGTTLELSLEGDEEVDQTVDLSSIDNRVGQRAYALLPP
ncbi:MAG: hypothetical protein AAGI23_23140 [Bacteroidota bacterium]